MAIARTALFLIAASAALAAQKETKVATSAKPVELTAGAVTVTLHPKRTSTAGSRRVNIRAS